MQATSGGGMEKRVAIGEDKVPLSRSYYYYFGHFLFPALGVFWDRLGRVPATLGGRS